MKQFFGAFFGSIIGLIITGIIIAVIIGASLISAFKSSSQKGSDDTYTPKENSVLKLDLNNEIKERGYQNPFGEMDLGPLMPKSVIGLNDILSNLKKAKSDKNIKGIYLEVGSPVMGFATLEEVRNAILDFKTSGKFVYAYAEGYTQKGYYVASAANKVFLNPQGALEIKGLSSQIMFYKNMLDKLQIEVQIFRHGKFKSAIEPFMLDKMSEANRSQVETYLGSIWNHMIGGIATSRKITSQEINDMANGLLIKTPEDAVKYKLVDVLAYEDEVMSDIKKTIKIEEKTKIAFAPFNSYINAKEEDKITFDNKIAVIYAVGEIVSGNGDDEKMGSIEIAKAIKDARLNDDIKAIVLRVNSPGGSALASDVMWRETVLAQKTKPFIVSMGDVAASGGYYISCAADRIFAQPNTITGSIGVFGMIPNAQKALSEKLGINIDTVNTNAHSDVGTILRGAVGVEHNYIQQSVERIYDVFITKVAQGRKINKLSVDSIGQGRVWSGADALKIHLVDEIGGIGQATNYAAKMAKITDYTIESFPRQKDPIEELLGRGKDEVETRAIKANFGQHYMYLKHLQNVMNLKGVQARLPYEMIIE